jgi:L-ascorbate metabolism protein UlaG (beta-lactamase superfamily)
MQEMRDRLRHLRHKPFAMTKLQQLWRVVRESHEQPITGSPRPVELVGPQDLGLTFIGHSSFLLQIGGRKILIDPVFAKRLVVLRRQRQPGLLVRELPAIDLVLLTHAHMDHLDITSLRKVIQVTRRLRGKAPEVIVPKGVEDLVTRLGFSQVHGLAWWEHIDVRGLRVTMTPCQHWGARMFRDTHRGYGGYVISTGDHSVYHSGDTAYFDGFREIGARLKPQVALLPIGAYFPDSYRTVHTSPEEAVRAFLELGAEQMVPMHYGTFRLGREPMDEPLQRLKAEAARLGINGQLKILEEGETMHLCVADRIP